MQSFVARMSSKGQVTVPVEVRRSLNLHEGDQVDFYLDPGTRSVQMIARNGKLSDLQGMLKVPPGSDLSPEAINKAIGEHLAADDQRITREWNELREFEEWQAAKALRAAE